MAVDLADAVLFDDGPAAAYLAGFERPLNQWTDPARRHRAALDAAITADPRWAGSFAYRLQSGDVAAVEAALRDLAVLARAQADRLFGPDAVDRAVDRAVERAYPGAGQYALTPPFQQNALDILIQRTDVVVTAYILVSSLTTEPGAPGELLHDRLVYEITTNLDARP